MAINKSVTLTADGKRELEDKLNFLKTVKRPEIADKIGRAASDGDLSENGAYHQAKEDQGRLEGQIAELEYVLRNAEVAEDTGDRVGIGKTVVVADETDSEKTYRIVSSHEVNAVQGSISDQSPIGAALMGARAGDSVEAQLPGRTRKLRIVAVH
ncbi:MAG TPA: transcription elongation factor GreA [Chloroflexota bacterium]